MKFLTLVVSIIILVVGGVFSSLNAQLVSFNYLIAKTQMPLSLLLALSTGVGLVLGLMFCFMVYLKLKAQIFRANNQLALTKKEIENLRTAPFKEVE